MKQTKQFHMVGLVALVILGFMIFLSSQGPVARSHAPAIAPTGCVQAPSGLVAWWPGDGNADDIVGGNNGTLMNGATFAPGLVGQAFSLDGSGDFVDTAATNWGVSTTLTVMAWIKTTDHPGDVFSLGHGASQDELLLAVAGGKIAIYNHKSLGNFNARFSDTIVNTGEWVHVAGVLDGGGSPSNLRIFVNGIEEVGVASTLGSPTDIVDTTPRQAILGWRTSKLTTDEFQGQIDEVALFNRALTAEEIQAIYNAGNAGKCKGEPPVAMCQDVTVSADNNCQAIVTPEEVNAGSFDPDGSALTLSLNPPGPFPLGETLVTLTVTDAEGQSATCAATVTVVDNTPPTVSCSVAQSVLPALWPPNHNLVNVGLNVSATDNCDNLTITVMVFGDEDDEEPTGDGTHSPDAKDIAQGTLRVRSERKGDADGRVYLIVVKATDDAGKVGVACCTVVVPLSQSQADKDAVDAQAAQARSQCLANNGAPPPGYFVIGDGPIIGPRQ
jgi:hypothetical protein